MEVYGHENHFESGNCAGFWASAHRLAYVAHVDTADGVSSAKPYDLAERQKRRQRGRVRPHHGAVRGLYHRRPHLDEHGDGWKACRARHHANMRRPRSALAADPAARDYGPIFAAVQADKRAEAGDCSPEVR